MGTVVRHHFAHSTGNRPCAGGAETGIHLAAKQLIVDRQEIPVPLLQAKVEGEDSLGYAVIEAKTLFSGCDRRKVDSTKLEFSLGDIRPDLIVTMGNTDILVEVAVTHYIDEEKRKRLAARGQRCIEIDLGDIDRSVTPGALEEHVYNHQRTYWIVNPKLEAEKPGLQQRLQQRIDRANARIEKARQAQVREEERLRKQAARREAYYRAQDEKRAAEQQEHKAKQRQERELAAKVAEERRKAYLETERQEEEQRRLEQQRAWEEECGQLDLEGMGLLARELRTSYRRIERHVRQAKSTQDFILPIARRRLPGIMYRMDLEVLPAALLSHVTHDGMFGVPPLEWKLVAFLEEIYTSGRLRKQEWVPIAVVMMCLDSYGYQPVAALHRAKLLLETIDRFSVLADSQETQALRGLPRPIDAIAEFLGELASYGMIELRGSIPSNLFCRPLERNRWC